MSEKTLLEKTLGVNLNIKGYTLLIRSIDIKEKTKGGVILSKDTIDNTARLTCYGQVIGMGPRCYTDEERFEGEIMCEMGDWVMYSAMERSPHTIMGKKCCVLRDDQILATLSYEDLRLIINTDQKFDLEEVV